jgi:hypothetical protein
VTSLIAGGPRRRHRGLTRSGPGQAPTHPALELPDDVREDGALGIPLPLAQEEGDANLDLLTEPAAEVR